MTSRRQVLKAAVGMAGVVVLPSALAACDASTSTRAPRQVPTPTTSGTPASAVATITLAQSAKIPDVTAGFTAQTGIDVLVNTVAGHLISDGADDYLGGSPEDVLMYITGYQMRRVAAKGLLEPLDDVWAQVGSGFPPALKEASTGDDGRIYAIPYTHGPWAVFYRRSLFTSRGYSIPTTWTEYLALADRMRRDGMTPLALGDLEGFPGLGLFAILNLRLNGYLFHTELIAGRVPWTDQRVHDTFVRLRELLATAGPNPAAVPFSDAATAFAERRAGMTYFGYWLTAMVPADVLPDLGMFPFPALETEFDAEHAVEDPSDAFVLPRNAPMRATDLDPAKAFLEYIATPTVQAQMAIDTGGLSALPAVELAAADRTALQEDGVRVIAAAQQPATQFLDRDLGARSQPLQDSIQAFVIEPDQPIDPLLTRIQAAWDASK